VGHNTGDDKINRRDPRQSRSPGEEKRESTVELEPGSPRLKTIRGTTKKPVEPMSRDEFQEGTGKENEVQPEAAFFRSLSQIEERTPPIWIGKKEDTSSSSVTPNRVRRASGWPAN